jgi:hypothetical protein
VTDGTLDAVIDLKNTGYGKIYNARKFEMVLRNTSNASEYTLPIPIDPRYWAPGSSQTLSVRLGIPKAVPFGNYELYVSFQDPAPRLYGIPEYAIRLANTGVWDGVKGYNSLKHTVKISSYCDNCVPVINSNNGIYLPKQDQLPKVLNRGTGSLEICITNIKPSKVTIDIHDLSGKKVSTIADAFAGTGMHLFNWNMRSGAGQSVATGTYYLRIRSEGAVKTLPVFVIRN